MSKNKKMSDIDFEFYVMKSENAEHIVFVCGCRGEPTIFKAYALVPGERWTCPDCGRSYVSDGEQIDLTETVID